MSAPKGICAICGREVTPFQRAAWRVSGWESERDAGGANQIKDRRRSGEVAHAACLDESLRRGRRGVGDEQESLA